MVHTDVSDIELLRRYAASGSRDELELLVRRYVDLVYSAARRQLGNGHWAEDVTQQVFVVLMRKAPGLRADTVLASWLLAVTAMECRSFVRGESRRGRRERKAADMSPEARTEDNDAEAVWDEVGPHLDAAMAMLSAGDRDAVVLRYLQNRSYDEAATILGTSEASVRQRVYRGLQKLRSVLASRGAVVTEAALGTALAAHAVEAAPAGLTGAAVVAMAQAPIKATGAVAAVWAQGKAVSLVAVVVLASVGVATLILLNGGGEGRAGAQGPANAATRAAATTQAAAQAPLFPALTGGPAAAAPEPVAPAKPERKLFDVITAKTADERRGTRDGFDHIAFITRGDWVCYRDIDLGPVDEGAQVMFCAVIACPPQFAGNEIEVHIGAADGPVAARLTVESSGAFNTFVPQVAPVEAEWRGVHDIYLVFTGGGFNVKSIKFTTDVRKADARIFGTSYAQAKSVNEAGRTLRNVRNGAWARYDGIDFGEAGMDGFEIAYSVDAAHAGGTISVRLDRPDAPSVRDVSIESTGGVLLPHTLKFRKAVTGKHDVYLTFAGTDRGYQGLADVAWFRFGDSAKLFREAALRTAPGETTTTTTTRPASGQAKQ